MPAKDSIPTSGIYQIRHIESGKVYIGSAVDIQHRWAKHRHALRKDQHHSGHLQRAWRKYGPDAFAFEILEVVPDGVDLIRIEQEYLDRLHPFDPEIGYNGSPTAGSPLGVKHTTETRAKVSAALAGRQHTAEERAQRGAANRRRKPGPETLAKIAAASAARTHSPESRAKIPAALSGRTCTPEHKAKVSAAKKGRYVDPQTRAKISAAKRGRAVHPNALAALALGRQAGKGVSAETQAKMSAALKGRKSTREAIAKVTVHSVESLPREG